MGVTTSTLPNAIDRRVRKHFLDTYPTVEPMLDQVFNIEEQEDFNEYEEDYQGLGDYESTAEGELYKEDTFGEGFQTVYIPAKKTKRVSISMEAQMWDKAMITKAENVGAELARAAANTIEKDAASVLLNGFATTSTSYGDAKPLFSTSHTRPDGGTAQSNASANGVPLSHEALELLMTQFRAQKNKRGRLINTKPTVLLVPPELEAEAKRITGSTLQSNTAENAINTLNMRGYYGGGLQVKVWEYLGVASGGTGTAFYLLDPSKHKLTWKWAKKPNTKKDDTTGIQNDLLYFLAMYYASKGWSDWIGVLGSKGDGAAYSS